jgi:hypothetical protein
MNADDILTKIRSLSAERVKAGEHLALADEIEEAMQRPVAIAEGRTLVWIASKKPEDDEEDQFLYALPVDAGLKIESQHATIMRLREALTGWSGYGWRDGAFVDELQEFFDEILAGKDTAGALARCNAWMDDQ